ncbi:MAG: GNAT family N-acetyltransferase [Bdellovibrio sp.]|jgi:ribosomal protein S18 acetylase RimI-like enzyme
MIQRLTELSGLDWVDRVHSSSFRWTLPKLQELAASHEFWGLFEEPEPGSKGPATAPLRPIAFVALIKLPHAWELPVLATHPAHQGRGQMRKLLVSVFIAKCQAAEIWLEVHEANLPARSLYNSLGFTEVGRRPRYYADGGTALLLSRRP